MIKTSASGELQWEKAFGGDGDDVAPSVDTTDDGRYIIIGYTNSFEARDYDPYLIKLDGDGDTQWTRTFGEVAEDRIITGEQTADGGYILVGRTRSFGTGNYDAYLVKIDSTGNPEWTKNVGGPRDDTGYGLAQTRDGGYVLAGYTVSSAGGSSDVSLIKVSADSGRQTD